MTDRQSPVEATEDQDVAEAGQTMARLLHGKSRTAAPTWRLTMPILGYIALAGIGAGIRVLVVPAGWEIAVACAAVLIPVGVVVVASVRPGRKEPGWLAAARTCDRAAVDLFTAEAGMVVNRSIVAIRTSTRRRPDGIYVYVARCTGQEPGMCHNARVVPVAGCLLIVIGEHVAAAPAMVLRATLAHEGRHVQPVRFFLTALMGVSRVLGWVVIGWAVPWPFVLAAAGAFHVGLMMLSWAVEISCDLGGADEAGVDAMLAALVHIRGKSAGFRARRSRPERYVRDVLSWVAGPPHPPLPARIAVVRSRWPQAQSR